MNQTTAATSVYVDELETGDVLLMMGNAEVSKVIAWCSDSIYSHAAIVADNLRLFEANADGARFVDIAKRVRETAGYLRVHAFRPHLPGAQQFGPADRHSVLRKIVSLETTPYPLGDILSLGMAVAARGKVFEDERLRAIFAMLLDLLIERYTGAMSCAELVFRCLAECDAVPAKKLAPQILFPDSKHTPFPPIDFLKLLREFCAGVAHDPVAKEKFKWICENVHGANALPLVSESDFAQRIERFREKYAIVPPDDNGKPHPNPNPRLVTPEEFAASPSCMFLGEVKVRGA
jgi:hypothetical protein